LQVQEERRHRVLQAPCREAAAGYLGRRVFRQVQGARRAPRVWQRPCPEEREEGEARQGREGRGSCGCPHRVRGRGRGRRGRAGGGRGGAGDRHDHAAQADQGCCSCSGSCRGGCRGRGVRDRRRGVPQGRGGYHLRSPDRRSRRKVRLQTQEVAHQELSV